ncbi:MAG: creatininase family protein [Anaerolineae bacterium]|nr:creatininase family protein [Anaerolineae bacterium]
MQWEHLTSTDFARAVQDTGVCIITMGVVEKHSEHLPLGTDFLTAHKIACLAAEKEPAVVFPPFYFGQIYEARCFPGTITLKPALLIELIQSVFDEIGRNGFKKIIVLNGHGGNNHLLGFLAQCSLWEEKPYQLYLPMRHLSSEAEAAWKEMQDAAYGGHACETETCQVLGTYPELVKMDRIPEEPAIPLGRLAHLPPTYTGIWWYSDYPNHYAGDARPATLEKGQKLIQWSAEYLADYIAAVKADTAVAALSKEFFERMSRVSG